MFLRYISIKYIPHAGFDCEKISVINGHRQGYIVDCAGCGLCDVIMGDMRYMFEFGKLMCITYRYNRHIISISFYSSYLICTYRLRSFYYDKKISYNTYAGLFCCIGL